MSDTKNILLRVPKEKLETINDAVKKKIVEGGKKRHAFMIEAAYDKAKRILKDK